jgi:hypothetical protein
MFSPCLYAIAELSLQPSAGLPGVEIVFDKPYKSHAPHKPLALDEISQGLLVQPPY